MKLTFLGTGSAFTCDPDNFQSNLLLEGPSGRRLLLDCGSDARRSLHRLGLTARDIHEVYISHIHADHVGGLEWLGFCTFFGGAPRPILHVAADLEAPLWETSLKGGMYELEGRGFAKLDTYFDVLPHAFMGGFTFDGVEFISQRGVHIDTDSGIKPSYGLSFAVNGVSVLWTSDSKFDPGRYAGNGIVPDIIFQDCETSPYPSHVHAHYGDLSMLDPAIKGRMWLYHYQDGPLPDAKADGFRGFVRPGRVFDFTNPETLR